METEPDSREKYAAWRAPSKRQNPPDAPMSTRNDPEYLKRHLEDSSLGRKIKGRLQEASLHVPHGENNLPRPFVEIGERGDESVEIGRLRADFSYEPVDLADQDLVQELPNFEPRKYRELTKWQLSSATKQINLSEILPPGFKVLISKEHGRSGWCSSDGLIVSTPNLATPRGVLTLLHEIGHARYATQHQELYDKDAVEKSYRPTMLNVLRSNVPDLKQERDAWAFALNTLKPLINKENSTFWFNRKAIHSYVHNRCLGYYSSLIKLWQYYENRDKTEKMRAAALEEKIAGEVMSMIDKIKPK